MRSQIWTILAIRWQINIPAHVVEDPTCTRQPWLDTKDTNVASLPVTHVSFVEGSSNEGTSWRVTWKNAWTNLMCLRLQLPRLYLTNPCQSPQSHLCLPYLPSQLCRVLQAYQALQAQWRECHPCLMDPEHYESCTLLVPRIKSWASWKFSPCNLSNKVKGAFYYLTNEIYFPTCMSTNDNLLNYGANNLHDANYVQ